LYISMTWENTITRINVVEPSTLHNKHLFAECRELPRVMSLARKSTADFRNAYQWSIHKKPPASYCLGKGHVNFFVNKIAFLNERYKLLCNEWKSRGYNVNQISEEDLLRGIDKSFINGYTPTQEATALNASRINQRLKEMKK